MIGRDGLDGKLPKIRYEIIIFWSEANDAHVAQAPELPGCMADGKTYHEALSNAERVIREWIETAQELGRPIPNRLRVREARGITRQ